MDTILTTLRLPIDVGGVAAYLTPLTGYYVLTLGKDVFVALFDADGMILAGNTDLPITDELEDVLDMATEMITGGEV